MRTRHVLGISLLATAAVVLIFTLGSDGSSETTSIGAQPSLCTDGGPEETGAFLNGAPIKVISTKAGRRYSRRRRNELQP